MKKIFFIGSCLLIAAVLMGCSLIKTKSTVKELTVIEAQAKAEKFINDNLVSAGSEVKVTKAEVEGQLYKLTVKLSSGQEVSSYLSKDGSKFYPEAYDIQTIENQTNTNTGTNANANTNQTAQQPTKNDKPVIELFVMSHCPYGTQIEKGILPVLDLLKDKISFNLKFCSYAMHGEVELQEQLRQYCLQQEQTDKLQTYLKCYLEAGDSNACQAQVGVDKNKLASCVDATDKQYKVTENYNNKATWQGNYPSFGVYAADNTKYGVQGSPTLVINGTTVSANRDPQSLLQAVCSAFTTAPAECGQTLSSAAPSAGFGSGTTNSNSSAACGT